MQTQKCDQNGLHDELHETPQQQQGAAPTSHSHDRDAMNTPIEQTEEKPPIYEIKNVKTIRVKKFKTTGTDYSIQFKDLESLGVNDMLNELHKAFDSIIDRVTCGSAPHDMVRMILTTN